MHAYGSTDYFTCLLIMQQAPILGIKFKLFDTCRLHIEDISAYFDSSMWNISNANFTQIVSFHFEHAQWMKVPHKDSEQLQ